VCLIPVFLLLALVAVVGVTVGIIVTVILLNQQSSRRPPEPEDDDRY
jgi:hypothetical protein